MLHNVLAHYEPLATSSAQTYNWHMGPGMMGFWDGGGMMGATPVFWVWSILAWVTWILIIAALIAFIRWLWIKGNRKS